MSAAEIIRHEETLPAKPDMLSIIASAAANPSVDVAKMQALLDMQERILRRDAEIAFNQDMQLAQSEMQPIVRDAENQSNRSRYTRLETLDAKIRPVYTRHGFSLTFNSAEPKVAGNVRVLCDVRHAAGHVKAYELEGDLDTAGPAGKPNKTGIQGLGSSVSYLRRYLTLMIFNIALTNEDNDGQQISGEFITEDQANKIYDMTSALDFDMPQMKRFMATFGVTDVKFIKAMQYDSCMEMLRAKLKRKQESV